MALNLVVRRSPTIPYLRREILSLSRSENVGRRKKTVLITEQIVVTNQVIADHCVLEFRLGEIVVQMVIRVIVAGETRVMQEMVGRVVRVVAGQSDRRGGR